MNYKEIYKTDIFSVRISAQMGIITDFFTKVSHEMYECVNLVGLDYFDSRRAVRNCLDIPMSIALAD